MSGPRNPYGAKLGVIEVGAFADMLLVDGNPLADIALITDPERNFKIIMKDGNVYKNTTLAKVDLRRRQLPSRNLKRGRNNVPCMHLVELPVRTRRRHIGVPARLSARRCGRGSGCRHAASVEATPALAQPAPDGPADIISRTGPVLHRQPEAGVGAGRGRAGQADCLCGRCRRRREGQGRGHPYRRPFGKAAAPGLHRGPRASGARGAAHPRGRPPVQHPRRDPGGAAPLCRDRTRPRA